MKILFPLTAICCCFLQNAIGVVSINSIEKDTIRLSKVYQTNNVIQSPTVFNTYYPNETAPRVIFDNQLPLIGDRYMYFYTAVNTMMQISQFKLTDAFSNNGFYDINLNNKTSFTSNPVPFSYPSMYQSTGWPWWGIGSSGFTVADPLASYTYPYFLYNYYGLIALTKATERDTGAFWRNFYWAVWPSVFTYTESGNKWVVSYHYGEDSLSDFRHLAGYGYSTSFGPVWTASDGDIAPALFPFWKPSRLDSYLPANSQQKINTRWLEEFGHFDGKNNGHGYTTAGGISMRYFQPGVGPDMTTVASYNPFGWPTNAYRKIITGIANNEIIYQQTSGGIFPLSSIRKDDYVYAFMYDGGPKLPLMSQKSSIFDNYSKTYLSAEEHYITDFNTIAEVNDYYINSVNTWNNGNIISTFNVTQTGKRLTFKFYTPNADPNKYFVFTVKHNGIDIIGSYFSNDINKVLRYDDNMQIFQLSNAPTGQYIVYVNAINNPGYITLKVSDIKLAEIVHEDGRSNGIKIVRAPLSTCYAPHTFQILCPDGIWRTQMQMDNGVTIDPIGNNNAAPLQKARKSKSILQYQNTYTPHQGPSIFKSYPTTFNFVVAKVNDNGSTPYFVSLESFAPHTNSLHAKYYSIAASNEESGYSVSAIRYSTDLINWSLPEVIDPSYLNNYNKFDWPLFYKQDNTSNFEIDRSNFFIIGASGSEGTGTNYKSRFLRLKASLNIDTDIDQMSKIKLDHDTSGKYLGIIHKRWSGSITPYGDVRIVNHTGSISTVLPNTNIDSQNFAQFAIDGAKHIPYEFKPLGTQDGTNNITKGSHLELNFSEGATSNGFYLTTNDPLNYGLKKISVYYSTTSNPTFYNPWLLGYSLNWTLGDTLFIPLSLRNNIASIRIAIDEWVPAAQYIRINEIKFVQK